MSSEFLLAFIYSQRRTHASIVFVETIMLFRAGVKLTRCCFFSAANYHQNATTRRTLPTKWMTRRKYVVVLPGRSVSCSASSDASEKAQNDVTMSKPQEVWKASIDFKSIRENQSYVETNCLNRNVTKIPSNYWFRSTKRSSRWTKSGRIASESEQARRK